MKNFNINERLRENIKNLRPYSSARDEFSGQGEYLFFDANENALGSVGTDLKYNRYPDPYQSEVKTLIAQQQKVKKEQIFLGNGSDEAIDLLFRAFCEPKRDKALIMPPTYGMYSVSAGINDVEIVKVPLTKDYQPDVEKVIQTVQNDDAIKLIFLCSPNNPTGNLLNKEKIIAILKSCNGIVVVDEAYIDFQPEASMLQFLNDYPNLVILQTFSKAWGLANLRLGKAFASQEIIQIFNNIKPPYNVNGYTQQVAIQALNNLPQKDDYIAEILKERNRLELQLRTLDLVETIYPSAANFFLVKTKPEATDIYELLLANQVVLRNRSRVHLCENCLRITIGTAEENSLLMQKLFEVNRLLS